MTTTDFLFHPDTGDLIIQNGDLVAGDATSQHQNDLLTSDKAHYKNAPVRGVGLTNYLNDLGTLPGLSGVVRSEFIADGMGVNQVRVSSTGVSIDASYS